MSIHRSLSVALLCAVAVLGASARGQDKSKTLRAAAQGRFLVGAAVMSDQLDQPPLARLITEQFDTLTCENEMKAQSLQPRKEQFTFDRADKVVAFAQAHDMKVIGHNLCWHMQSPAWMFADEKGKPLPRDAALANLQQHITAVMRHFKGKVKGWDVVNEALGDFEPYLRDTPARRAIGDDYVIKAFEFAHEADAQAELYYNDYNMEMSYKRHKAVRLIRELKAAGVRLDAIGVQGHWLIDTPLNEIDDGLRTLSAEGMKLMITELDVDVLPRGNVGGADVNAIDDGGADPFKNGLSPAMHRKLAERYRELFKLFLKFKVTRVTFWGSDDGHSWLNYWPTRGRTNHPLLFDRQLQPKPAFDAVLRVLEEP